jgi:hypothetical protein
MENENLAYRKTRFGQYVTLSSKRLTQCHKNSAFTGPLTRHILLEQVLQG